MSSVIRSLVNASYLVLKYRYFLKSQFLPVEKIQEYQLKRLKHILQVATTQVPYYKALSIPVDFELFSFNELMKFPKVNKELIRANLDSFIRSDIDKSRLEWKTTSGSTGKPFATPKHRISDALEGIMGYRAWSMGKDKVYSFRSPAIVLRSYSPGPNDKIYKYDRVRRYWYLSCYHINDAHFSLYREVIEKSGATILRGYPSSIFLLTLLMKKNGVRFPAIKTLVCASEMLLPGYRHTIEEYWGIRVLDWYGQNERTVTVQQCWAGNYHNNDEYGYLELDEDRQIIATSLWNDVMPLIRYETRDKAIPYVGNPYACPCGRKLRIPFLSIEGRSDDIIVKDDQTGIPSINFYTAMEPFQRVDQFKMIQHPDQSITLLLTSSERLDDDYLQLIREALRQRVGTLPLEIRRVDEIPRNKATEKVKAFESHYQPFNAAPAS